MKKYFFLIVIPALLLTGCRSSILQDPSTLIEYDVPQLSHVTLTVENSYNTVVRTLVDADQGPGTYKVTFDASSLQEGVYFYTLECKGIGNSFYFKITKRLVLLK
jgi:hypothetical protein